MSKTPAELKADGFVKVSPPGLRIHVWEKHIARELVDEVIYDNDTGKVYEVVPDINLLDGDASGIERLSDEMDRADDFNALLQLLKSKAILTPSEVGALRVRRPRPLRPPNERP